MPFHGYIPAEIIELIVHEIALVDDQKSFPALKSCAASARVFLESSRRYIWQSVEFIAPKLISGNEAQRGAEKYQRLRYILRASPQTALYTKCFHLQDNFTEHSILNQKTFPALINEFKNVTTFRWTFNPDRLVEGYDWRLSSTPVLRQALTNKFFASGLEKLSISYVKNLPREFGKNFSFVPNVYLEEITFSISSWLNAPVITPALNGRLKNLTICTLDIDKCQPLIDAVSFTDFKLETLKLTSRKQRWIDDIFIAAALACYHVNSLHTLEYSSMQLPPVAVEALSIGSISSLRTIKVHLQHQDPNWVETAINILKNAATPNEIREIIIESSDSIVRKIKMSRRATGELDMLLCGPSFPKLEQVKFLVGLGSWLKLRATDICINKERRLVAKAFRGIYGRRILSVDAVQ